MAMVAQREAARLHPHEVRHINDLARAHFELSVDESLAAVAADPAPSPTTISALLSLEAVRASEGSA